MSAAGQKPVTAAACAQAYIPFFLRTQGGCFGSTPFNIFIAPGEVLGLCGPQNFFWLYFVLFLALGMEPIAFFILGKFFIIEPYSKAYI